MSFSSGLKVASLGGRLAVVDAAGHEEADTKIVSHIQDALRAGHKSIVVTTVDTDDMVIILIGHTTTPFLNILTLIYGSDFVQRHIDTIT